MASGGRDVAIDRVGCAACAAGALVMVDGGRSWWYGGDVMMTI